ncbi:hypothetical protein C5167_039299 [Papaver somniferum]|uniref:Uncharacterized protein n=1 Tax=Papaver somniferum TaxID=3469 RepID=A0A4Y7IG02_PAPSO|nr:hypothetical protein C5167_039299 [Papaver somniferum]
MHMGIGLKSFKVLGLLRVVVAVLTTSKVTSILLHQSAGIVAPVSKCMVDAFRITIWNEGFGALGKSSIGEGQAFFQADNRSRSPIDLYAFKAIPWCSMAYLFCVEPSRASHVILNNTR